MQEENDEKYLAIFEHVWLQNCLPHAVVLTYFTPYLYRRAWGLFEQRVDEAIPAPVYIWKWRDAEAAIDDREELDTRGERVGANDLSQHFYTVEACIPLPEGLADRLNPNYFIRLIAELAGADDAELDIKVEWKRFSQEHLLLRRFRRLLPAGQQIPPPEPDGQLGLEIHETSEDDEGVSFAPGEQRDGSRRQVTLVHASFPCLEIINNDTSPVEIRRVSLVVWDGSEGNACSPLDIRGVQLQPLDGGSNRVRDRSQGRFSFASSAVFRGHLDRRTHRVMLKIEATGVGEVLHEVPAPYLDWPDQNAVRPQG